MIPMRGKKRPADQSLDNPDEFGYVNNITGSSIYLVFWFEQELTLSHIDTF